MKYTKGVKVTTHNGAKQKTCKMKTTVKNIEELKNENAYTLFNRGGAYFNEKFLDHVVLEHQHETIINGVKFYALDSDRVGKFTFEIKTTNGGYRKNTTQIRYSA